MKIAYCGLGLTPGKIKYNDPILNELEKKFKPKKFTPYFFELCENEFEKCEATVIAREKLLDLLVLDLEKLEARLERSEDDKEKAVAKKCIAELEKEVETQGEEMRELTHATLVLVRKKLEEEQERERSQSRFN